MLVAARRSLSLAAARTRAASTYNTEKTTFLLNWCSPPPTPPPPLLPQPPPPPPPSTLTVCALCVRYANPYHTPIYVAKEQGWLKEEGSTPARTNPRRPNPRLLPHPPPNPRPPSTPSPSTHRRPQPLTSLSPVALTGHPHPTPCAWLGIDLAILEATDPSDVTEIVGDGAIGLGLKAMIHILAAKDKGIDMKSFGTLLDEPPTGLIHKKSANINKFSDIQGKKVGTQPLHPHHHQHPFPLRSPAHLLRLHPHRLHPHRPHPYRLYPHHSHSSHAL